jgi:hypothetical protein
MLVQREYVRQRLPVEGSPELIAKNVTRVA